MFATLRRLAPFADAPGLLKQVVQVLIDTGCAHVRQDDVDPAPAAALNRVLAERGMVRWRAVAEPGGLR